MTFKSLIGSHKLHLDEEDGAYQEDESNGGDFDVISNNQLAVQGGNEYGLQQRSMMINPPKEAEFQDPLNLDQKRRAHASRNGL